MLDSQKDFSRALFSMVLQRKSLSYAWIVWVLAALFFFGEYFARVAPSVMVTDLMRDFRQ